MLFDLPDDDTLYAALQARDASYDGRAYVAVTTTHIFCRLNCPARDPKRENCRFFATPADCLHAGFRPCRRCHPMGQSDPQVTQLLKALEARPDHVFSEKDVTDMGFDPSRIRRAFKRQFGMTFLDIARTRRLQTGMATLARGERVIDAQIDAGFDSASAFRAAFQRLTGIAPGVLRKDARLQADWIETPLGPMIAVADTKSLYLLEFLERKALPSEFKRLMRDAKGDLGFGRLPPITLAETQLNAYHAGQSADFNVPLAPGGTEFQRAVWDQLRQIPAGETRSYSDIAAAMGKPSATRAVAAANGANPIAIMVPCHRVIGADGNLTGYGGGLWRKDRLIALEHSYLTKDLP